MNFLDNKQDIIINLSIILNRGSSDESELTFFAKKKHDNLVQELRSYIEKHKNYIGHTQLEFSQSLNDHGVDLLLKVNEECKIGFQIKNHSDVKDSDFSQIVKRQMTESLYHQLDKWYLLICSPYKYKNEDYTKKINYLINEFNCYSSKTNYHCVFGPQTALRMFKSSELTEKEFVSNKSMYDYGSINNEQILSLFTIKDTINKDNNILKKERYKKSYSIYKKIKYFVEGLKSNDNYSIIVKNESIENILEYLDICNFEFFFDKDIILLIKEFKVNIYRLKNNGLMYSYLRKGNIIEYLKLKNNWNDDTVERFEDNEFYKWNTFDIDVFIQKEENTDFEDIANCIIDDINKTFDDLKEKLKNIFR